MVYKSEDLSLLNTVTLDESPAIVIPHYDADSNTLFLSGKGESTVSLVNSPSWTLHKPKPEVHSLNISTVQYLHSRCVHILNNSHIDATFGVHE